MWEELKTMDGDERFRYIFGNIICFIWIVGLCYYAFVDSRRWRSTGLITIIEDKRFQLQEETVRMVMENSGTREPKFSGSFSNTLTYKGWSWSMNLSLPNSCLVTSADGQHNHQTKGLRFPGSILKIYTNKTFQ